jgi:hypothetical protein
MPYEETEATTAITVGGRVTGPLGIWSYPILARLAQYFPWAKQLLTTITSLRK